jgi:hypothetical protein
MRQVEPVRFSPRQWKESDLISENIQRIGVPSPAIPSMTISPPDLRPTKVRTTPAWVDPRHSPSIDVGIVKANCRAVKEQVIVTSTSLQKHVLDRTPFQQPIGNGSRLDPWYVSHRRGIRFR